jgi:ubiquinone/menaquinone biosynthesis C-methylase UbiE
MFVSPRSNLAIAPMRLLNSSRVIIPRLSSSKHLLFRHGTQAIELNPWDYMSDEDLKKFLTDERNNENAPDRVFVINYLKEQAIPVQILDVGSGTGNMYLALKKSVQDYVYVGVDKTVKMVNFAKKRFPEAKSKFIQGDIHDLGFPDKMWKVVYCRHVLDHLNGYEKALSELARVCSDCLVICLLNQLADKQQIKVIGKPPSQTAPNQFSEHFLNTYPRKQFTEALKNLGFNVVVDQLIQVGGFFKFYHLIIARRVNLDVA